MPGAVGGARAGVCDGHARAAERGKAILGKEKEGGVCKTGVADLQAERGAGGDDCAAVWGVAGGACGGEGGVGAAAGGEC